MFRKANHIHFTGIGGVGMSGIAEVLLNMGYRVSGSDLAETAVTRRLQSLGATVFKGHAASNIENAHVLVVSSAIKPDNPEVSAAREIFVPVIPRAEMLAELMRSKFGIAIGGTHGKTTTTSLIAAVLNAADFDPTIVIGGRLDLLGSNAKLGTGEYMVAEADESDGSFLLLSPTISVITNIDPEHMDHYSDIDEVKHHFEIFANKIPFYGLVVLCIDHQNVQSLIPRINKRYTTYGLSKQAFITATDVVMNEFSTRFTVVHDERGELGAIELGMPGLHNVYNTLATVCVGLELEIPFETIAKALHGFSGVHRRFERVGEADGVLVIDDYGHHPVEIKATLAAAKAGFDRRVVAVFQPHRYTRTRDRYDEFLTAFNEADVLIITDIYAASEKPIEGVTAKKLYDGVRACGHKNVYFEPDKTRLAGRLMELARPGDMVVTLGAGDITKVAWEFYEALKRRKGN